MLGFLLTAQVSRMEQDFQLCRSGMSTWAFS